MHPPENIERQEGKEIGSVQMKLKDKVRYRLSHSVIEFRLIKYVVDNFRVIAIVV